MTMSVPPYDQALDKDSRSIRLLEILPQPHSSDGRLQCRLIITSLASAPAEYQALSYAWGLPDYFNYRIWLNDVLVPVRWNLLCALRVLRANEKLRSVYIWIDALCINQADTTERGHQVDMMGAIFKNARQVIAWLGSPDGSELYTNELDTTESHPLRSTVPAFDFMARVVQARFGIGVEAGRSRRDWVESYVFDSYNPGVKDFSRVCSLDYWKRLWIIQELCLAEKLVLLRGTQQISWTLMEEFKDSYLRVSQSFISEGSNYDITNTRQCQPWNFDGMMRFGSEIARHGWSRIDLATLLELSSDCGCQDRRDKIYGLLGLAADANEYGLAADYTLSLYQLYSRVVLLYSEIHATPLPCSTSRPTLIRFSQTLQKSLLGSDYDITAYADMKTARMEAIANDIVPQPRFCISGSRQGQIVRCGASLDALSEQGVSHSELRLDTHLSQLGSQLRARGKSLEQELKKLWESDGNLFDLILLGSGIDSGLIEHGLDVFVTDKWIFGVAPKGVGRGDILWGEALFPTVEGFKAIVRKVAGEWKVAGRACYLQELVGSFDSQLSAVTTGSGDEMTVSLSMAELQILSCPSRYRKFKK